MIKISLLLLLMIIVSGCGGTRKNIGNLQIDVGAYAAFQQTYWINWEVDGLAIRIHEKDNAKTIESICVVNPEDGVMVTFGAVDDGGSCVAIFPGKKQYSDINPSVVYKGCTYPLKSDREGYSFIDNIGVEHKMLIGGPKQFIGLR